MLLRIATHGTIAFCCKRIPVKNSIFAFAFALLCASCNSTTSGISESRADPQVRKACPAFRMGGFSSASARTYGTEQVTIFKNGSRFECRCIVKSAEGLPVCNQTRSFPAALLQQS